jgi:uncharacterized membrane protein required for colicin V production
MDVALVGFIAAMTFAGWRTGFVRRAIGLAFIALSLVLGAYLRVPFGSVVSSFFKNIPPDYAQLVGYAFVFPVVLGVAHVIAHPLLKDRQVGGLTSELNKGLGAAFGFVEAVLIVSALVVIVDTYIVTLPTAGQLATLGSVRQLIDAFDSSTTVQLLRDTTVPVVLTVLGPLLPKDISSILPKGLPNGLPSGLPFPKS